MTNKKIIGVKMNFKYWILFSFVFAILIGCEESDPTQKSDSAIQKLEGANNLVSVEAMIVKKSITEQKLPLTGVLIPNNSVDIIAEVPGKITELNKHLGDYVNAGQTLALVDDIIPLSQYKQAEAQVLSTESNLKIVRTNLQSDKSLFENGDISELAFNNSQLAASNAEAQYLSALAQLSAAKKTFDDTRIKSPISGFVSRKNINLGAMAVVGSPVYRVVDLSKMKIVASVPQELISRISVGVIANISITSLNKDVFNGLVKRISPQADESTGGFMIEIEVENKGSKIKAGMTAKFELLLSSGEEILTIPNHALVSKNGEDFVYLIKNKTATLTKIVVGETIGKQIIVNSGLALGDTIVVVGMKNLGLDTKIRVEVLH